MQEHNPTTEPEQPLQTPNPNEPQPTTQTSQPGNLETSNTPLPNSVRVLIPPAGWVPVRISELLKAGRKLPHVNWKKSNEPEQPPEQAEDTKPDSQN